MGRPRLGGALVLIALLAALALAAQAAAALQPIDRDVGELSVPRVRPGRIELPSVPASGRVRVLVRLRDAPLAAWQSRRLSASGGARRLNVREPIARRYLAALAESQARTAAEIERAVPSAVLGRRFRILLNAIAVEVPPRSVGRLASLPGVTRVYPSLRYTLRLNTSPSVIGATPFSTATGARGEGMKIAIVDDGVDPANPFFDPSGYVYPEGFPKGQGRFTTVKIIVARSFAAPETPERSRLAFDKPHTFHGTHVAGIAAGNAGTTATRGSDHPDTPGLSGVAPRAWIGNYRVFSLPTPAGDQANTPEILAAFEAAVADGMDVINFSGGGPETEPENDALIEAIANVAAAGVVPVIAAGNDRDEFGTGSINSPGTAPAAITVAAVSDSHVFAPPLSVEGFRDIPYQGAAGALAPSSWALGARPVVDVGSIQGTDSRPVERHLCAPGRDPNAARSTLPRGSLEGTVALVSRGFCTFVSKVQRAREAGAVGLVVVDNRPGEANQIPAELEIPALMISDLDGAQLRDFLASVGGRAPIRAEQAFREFDTGRSGVVTSFSSAGPTALAHALKPDVAAPGGAILSSTSPTYARSPFAVFDGTSMATPHVAGAAALLLERHPDWTPAQVKSALASTAGPAWGDTARTAEAAVWLEGGGLIAVDRADNPLVFTAPTSLSFGDLDVSGGAASRSRTLELTDAGGGAGEWDVEVRPQSSPTGSRVEAPATVAVPGALQVSAVAAPGAESGDAYGFVVLRRDAVERHVPYLFLVTRPRLRLAKAKPLLRSQAGSTKTGSSRASVYRFPGAPFGHPPDFGSTPTNEDGGEDLYVITLDRPVANFGVAVETQSARAAIDPFVLGSPDENDVQGMAGIPVNVNILTDSYGSPNGAAAAILPAPGRYYVSVDSGRDEFTGSSHAGSYVLRSWLDDVEPPTVRLETPRVAGRRPLIVVRVLDAGAGVDPLTLELSYGGFIVGATSYDPNDGLALFPIPAEARELQPGRNRLVLNASDYQESKNLQTTGTDLFPNTARVRLSILVTPGRVAVSWLAPRAGRCAGRGAELLVAADGPRRIELVRFLEGDRVVGVDRKGEDGLFSVRWRTAGEPPGKHVLRAEAVDRAGNTATAARIVRVCR